MCYILEPTRLNIYLPHYIQTSKWIMHSIRRLRPGRCRSKRQFARRNSATAMSGRKREESNNSSNIDGSFDSDINNENDTSSSGSDVDSEQEEEEEKEASNSRQASDLPPLRVLEVGAINTQLSRCSWLQVRAIDIHSQHPLIEEADLFDLPPRQEFDVVVSSMV